MATSVTCTCDMALTTHGPVSPLSSNESFTLGYAFEGRHPRLYIGDFPDWSTNTARKHIVDLIAFAALHESESGPLRWILCCNKMSALGARAEVAVRTSSARERVETAWLAGAAAYLPKPFSESDLNTAIERVLEPPSAP